MRTALCLLAACCLLPGCASIRPKNDPFFGPQIVPAPATASSTGQRTPPPSSYYSDRGPGGTAPAGTPGPTPGAGDPYAPPGGSFDYSGMAGRAGANAPSGFRALDGASGGPAPAATAPMRSSGPDDKRPGAPSGGSAWPASTGNSGAYLVPSGQPMSSNTSGSNTSGGSAASNSASSSTTWNGSAAGATALTEQAGLFRPPVQTAGYTETAHRSPIAAASYQTPANSDYGHDSNYRWLSGRLEYLAASRRWKLRYIPISGETDAYGGSVVLTDSPQLQEFRAGEFVRVQGRLQEADVREGYAPTYVVQQIEPLR